MNTKLYTAHKLTKQLQELTEQLEYKYFLESHLSQILIELERQIEIEEKHYLFHDTSF